MAILRDGTKLQNVRTALLSRRITRRLKSNDKTDFKSPVYGRRVIRSLQITFSSTNDCSSRTPTLSVTTMWLLFLLFYYKSYVYIDVILEELFSSSITNSKLPAVISDPFPEFDQSINQSV